MTNFVDDFKSGANGGEDNSFGAGMGKLWTYITHGFTYPTVDYDKQAERLEEKIGESLVVGGNTGSNSSPSSATNIVGSILVVVLLIFVIFDR